MPQKRSVAFPDFTDSHCEIFSLCGPLEGLTGEVEQQLAEVDLLGGEIVTRYRSSGSYVYARVNLFKDEDYHLHIDLAAESYFGSSQERPKTTVAFATVKKRFQTLLGLHHTPRLRYGFRLPVGELGPKGKGLLLQPVQKSEEQEMQLTGAEFTFTGGTLKTLSWRLRKDAIHFDVSLAPTRLSIDQDYLASAFRVGSQFVDGFVRQNEEV